MQIPVQAKLAAAWASFMFSYVYVDILGLYMPGVVDDILGTVVAQLVVASLYVIVSAGNALGEPWTYDFTLAVGLEVLVVAAVIRWAWTWPRAARATVDRTPAQAQV